MNDVTIEQDTTQEALDVAIVAPNRALSTPAQAPMMPSSFDFGAALSAMMEKACDPNLDKEKFLVLKDTLKEWRSEEAERAFNWDMSLAQAEMQAVVRSSEVKLIRDGKDLGSYNYASLDAIDLMLRPIRTKYGFSITHDRKPRMSEGGGLEVVSTLRHRSGHSITASFPLALDSGPGRSNAQAYGSTDSYGRKYNAIGFFDVIRKNDDDDGITDGGHPITFDEAAVIKKLVDEAGIGEGLNADDRKTAIIEWFNDMLGYPLPKGYISIRREDDVRVRRALLSLKARHLTTIEQRVKI